MTADLSALIARLEAAEVGSRELDEAVWLACGLDRKVGGPIDAAGNGVWEGPHVSHFIDAALALAERLGLQATDIMHHTWSMMSKKHRLHCCFYAGGDYARDAALQACIAILRAKQGEET